MNRYRMVKSLCAVAMCVFSTFSYAENVTLTGLRIVSIGVDATGPNRLVHVSPTQSQCYAIGTSKMLFNNSISEPNTSMIYSTLLAAMMADKTVDVIHDGTSYCKIVRVTIVK